MKSGSEEKSINVGDFEGYCFVWVSGDEKILKFGICSFFPLFVTTHPSKLWGDSFFDTRHLDLE